MSFNWVDLGMVVLLALGINSGRKSDFFTELLTFLGVLFASCFSMHFYVRFGHLLNQQLVLPPHSQELLAFLFITGVLVSITLLAKGGWLVIVKFNINRHVDNWGAMTFAILKTYFLCGLVFFALLISGQPSIENFARKSLSYHIFRKAPHWIYSICYTGFIGNFFSEEPLNQKAFRVIQEP